MKKQLLGVVSAFAMTVGLSTTASALTFDQITNADNAGVTPVYGTPSRNGWYGGQLYLVGGPADIRITYFGSEAGFKNQFFFGGNLLFTTPGGVSNDTWDTTGNGFVDVLGVNSGLLDFFFKINGGNGGTATATNGSNPDTKTGDPTSPDFFLTFLNQNAASGTRVDLWLDDGGTDDNHDDMMVRLEILRGGSFVVPIPAALPLLLSGLAGLGFIGRRRRVVAA